MSLQIISPSYSQIRWWPLVIIYTVGIIIYYCSATSLHLARYKEDLGLS